MVRFAIKIKVELLVISCNFFFFFYHHEDVNFLVMGKKIFLMLIVWHHFLDCPQTWFFVPSGIAVLISGCLI